jgi:hypothetical protein
MPFPVKSRTSVKGLKMKPAGEKSMNFAGLPRVVMVVLATAVMTAVVAAAQPGLSQADVTRTGLTGTDVARTDYRLHASPVSAAPADPAISAALAQVSEARIRQTVEKLVGFGTRDSLSSMETDLPPGQGVSAAADWLFAQFEAVSKECGGCLEVKRDTFTAEGGADPQWAGRIPKPTQMTNVYAILRGNGGPAQAKRMYLVTGHYDSRNSNVLDAHGGAPGANDDATGVAVSLECARVLSKLKLPASLVFVAVAGEEQGLVGSAHLAKLAKDAGWQLEGGLNNDIVGGNTTPGDGLQRKDTVRVFSEGIPATATPEQLRRVRALGAVDDAPSRQLARAMSDAARTYLANEGFNPFLVSRPDRYLRGGDHTSFNREGFTAVRITEWREDFNHQHQNVRVENGVQYGDLLQFVDFGYVVNVAKLNAATLATLAASPGIPAELKLATEKLDNETTLSWKAPAGAPADTRYELLWRETTASGWQYAQTVPAAQGDAPVTVTLPVSKDNVIFGVRAVDGAGHRGLAATP